MEFEFLQTVMRHEIGNNLVGDALTLVDASSLQSDAKGYMKALLKSAIRRRMNKALLRVKEYIDIEKEKSQVMEETQIGEING